MVKFLGIYVDPKLNYSAHVTDCCTKAIKLLMQCRRVIGKTWGLTPRVAYWLYHAVILPTILYGSIIWWRRTSLKTCCKKLDSVQRLACLCISGAFRTTPTKAIEMILGIMPLSLNVLTKALLTYHRLERNGLWGDENNTGHCSIANLMAGELPAALVPSDNVTKRVHFHQGYDVCVSERDVWNPDLITSWDPDMVIYTDGSRTNDGTGAGVFLDSWDQGISLGLNHYNSVFQAELFAILIAATDPRVCLARRKRILICSDSQSALRAISAYEYDSVLVGECRMALERLSVRNNVRLIWVPGHSGVAGNEAADELAKAGTGLEPEEAALRVGASKSLVKRLTGDWATAKASSEWLTLTGLRQSKIFIPGLNPGLSKILLRLGRKRLRLICCMLTGHAALNRHLSLMQPGLDPICPRCRYADETAEHVLLECHAYDRQRVDILGDYADRGSIFTKVGLNRLSKYIVALGRF